MEHSKRFMKRVKVKLKQYGERLWEALSLTAKDLQDETSGNSWKEETWWNIEHREKGEEERYLMNRCNETIEKYKKASEAEKKAIAKIKTVAFSFVPHHKKKNGLRKAK